MNWEERTLRACAFEPQRAAAYDRIPRRSIDDCGTSSNPFRRESDYV